LRRVSLEFHQLFCVKETAQGVKLPKLNNAAIANAFQIEAARCHPSPFQL